MICSEATALFLKISRDASMSIERFSTSSKSKERAIFVRWSAVRIWISWPPSCRAIVANDEVHFAAGSQQEEHLLQDFPHVKEVLRQQCREGSFFENLKG